MKLVRKIKSSLQDDRRHQTAAVGAKIVGLLGAGELAGAWNSLRGWYTAAVEPRPKPSHKNTEKQTVERVELYERVPPPGDPIPINISPKEVPDACPREVELRACADYEQRPSRRGSGRPTGRRETEKGMQVWGTHGAGLRA